MPKFFALPKEVKSQLSERLKSLNFNDHIDISLDDFTITIYVDNDGSRKANWYRHEDY